MEDAFPLPPGDFILALLVAIPISVLIAMSEVAAAYKDSAFPPRRAVFHPWALPLYVLYGGLTLLLGLVLFEHEVLDANWTSAVLLGLAGPALFKSNLTLFRSISGSQSASANLERLINGVQDFCFTHINRAFARERLTLREKLVHEPEDKLMERVRMLYSDKEYQRIEKLIAERQESGADIRPLLVELIARKDETLLDHPLPQE